MAKQIDDIYLDAMQVPSRSFQCMSDFEISAAMSSKPARAQRQQAATNEEVLRACD